MINIAKDAEKQKETNEALKEFAKDIKKVFEQFSNLEISAAENGYGYNPSVFEVVSGAQDTYFYFE